MIFIAHRGNINGSIRERENTEEYIQEALNAGYDVEVDLWDNYGEWWLGHDNPKHKTSSEFISKHGLWLHAKCPATLNRLGEEYIPYSNVEYFSQEWDSFSLTSGGRVWLHDKHPKALYGAILVKKEYEEDWITPYVGKVHGICTDYPERYKEEYEILQQRW